VDADEIKAQADLVAKKLAEMEKNPMETKPQKPVNGGKSGSNDGPKSGSNK